MKETGTVYFFTGLAGAGKTTIGGLFYQRLLKKKPEAVLLDGDQIRGSIGDSSPDTGAVLNENRYTTEARKSGAKFLFQNCRTLSEQGKDVVCCSISMYSDIRQWNRENIKKYKEIYIKVNQETLYRRDQKKLYSSSAKNVVGVDLPYDEPGHSSIVIQNDGGESPDAIVDRLWVFFELDRPLEEPEA
ncbi:MAG: adenylyl-sulfate kinase [Oscillospiraceae bacterium]|jgi:adenylylsulfate kinase-like enzyme|nr:adenylyl-sulfate kinase [Oscillospiraceae bacterium]